MNIPRGSKYPIYEDSGPKNHTLNGIWDQESLNDGYLDPLGYPDLPKPLKEGT